MDRTFRTRIPLLIIMVGLLNFLAYTLGYWILQGDASNGAVVDGQYYLRGHFIRESTGLMSEPVSRSTWVYSYVHSISIWPTIGAVLVSMLVLAKPHLNATVGVGARRWAAPIIAFSGLIVILITAWYTVHFTLDFQQAMTLADRGQNYGVVP